MKELKFFVCTHCGNLAGMVYSSGVPMICCGEPMKELVPNTVDAAGVLTAGRVCRRHK